MELKNYHCILDVHGYSTDKIGYSRGAHPKVQLAQNFALSTVEVDMAEAHIGCGDEG